MKQLKSKKNFENKSASKSMGKGVNKQDSKLALLIPLVLVLGLIPLVVRLELLSVAPEVQPFWKTTYDTDFFSYYKAILLILAAVYMVILMAYFYKDFLHHTLTKYQSLRVYFIAVGVYVLFTVVSTLFAQYKDVALFGAPERHEGMFILLAYVVILLFSLWAYLKYTDFRYILLPLSVTTAVVGFLGVFQFFGHDLVTTTLGQILVVPATYRAQGTLDMQFEYGKIYGTMYHYNYMGSFAAMVLPLFLVLAMFLKEKKHKAFCAAFAAISLFLLLGSTSRAGIVGTSLVVICFVIIFAKKLAQHAKATIGTVAVLLVLVLGINMVTDGLALARIPSLLSDMKSIVSSSEVDYHDEISVRHIALEEQKATFTMHDYSTFTVEKNAQGLPVLSNSAGESVVAAAENGTVSVGNQKFEIQYVTLDNEAIPFLGVYIDGRVQLILGLFDNEFSFVNERIQRIVYEEAPAIGFEGKERLGSARGYIWSRSIPMMLEHLIIGSGPDTYFAEFPQGDYLAKLYAYDSAQMLVDKPHNLYLQIGIQQGGIALVAFLVIIGAYLVHSFRLYALRKDYRTEEVIGAALTLSIIGYLGAGIFNDSVVSVAPIFWVLLGTGIAINMMNTSKKSDAAE